MAKNKEDKGPDKTFWMVTFSDLLSLMLTFFVLLLSMSSMQEKELRKITSAFQEGLGVLGFGGPFGMSVRPTPPQVNPQFRAAYREDSKVLHKNLRAQLEKTGSSAKIGTDEAKGKTSVELDTKALFAPGTQGLSAEAQQTLSAIGDVLRYVPGKIRIVGFTDNIPLNGTGRRADNMALSLSRAISVASYLHREAHLDAQRIRVAGYGALKPVADNATAAGRAANRRIQIDVIQN